MIKSKLKYLIEALDILSVNETLSKKEFIEKHWYTDDYFTQRSFDVFFSNAKKTLPSKTFCGRINREIKRLL